MMNHIERARNLQRKYIEMGYPRLALLAKRAEDALVEKQEKKQESGKIIVFEDRKNSKRK